MNRLSRKISIVWVLIFFLYPTGTCCATAETGAVSSLQTTASHLASSVSSSATVVTTSVSPEDKHLVILVQDAHCNLPVQRAIMHIVKTVNEKLTDDGTVATPLVMQEGGMYGAVDTSILKEGKSAEELDGFLADELKAGRIGAAEFLHAKFGEFDFAGIEDPELYEKNYEAFMQLSRHEEDIVQFISTVREKFEAIRALISSDAFQEVYSLIEKARDPDGPREGYLTKMALLVHQYSIPLDAYPVLRSLFETMDNLAATDGIALRDELERLQAEASFQLPEKAEGFALGKALANSSVSLEMYPALYRYRELMRTVETTDAAALVAEKDALEDELLLRVAATDDERDLVTALRAWNILEKLLQFQLTREEYDYYTASTANQKEALVTTVMRFIQSYYVSYILPPWFDTVYAAAQTFYTIVNDRDRVLAGNIARLMKANNVPVAIAVTGGFHSDSIKDALRKQGMGVLVLQPSVERIDRDSMKKYSSVMRDMAPVS